ncbi:MAG: MerC family mercury resistance protein [Burkholderiales bacterium]
MKELMSQLLSLAGAGFAAACCAGVTAALSLFTAVGAGFLINDAVLIPLFAAMLALSVWLLYRSAHAHGDLKPFWLGLAGAVFVLSGFLLTTILIYAGLGAIVVGSVWDFQNGRRKADCAPG